MPSKMTMRSSTTAMLPQMHIAMAFANKALFFSSPKDRKLDSALLLSHALTCSANF